MNTQPPPVNLKNELRALRIFFFALVTGALLFSVIVLAVNFMQKTVSPGKDFEIILLIAAIAIGAASLFAAKKIYAKRIAAAKDSLNPLADKLNQYRPALILYMALCEGPALFSIIIFFITGNYYMFIITTTMIAAMLTKVPTRSRLADELGLNWQEQQEL